MFFQHVRLPRHLHTDGAKELNEGRWKDIRNKIGGIKQTNTVPNNPWQNRVEAGIRELKKYVKNFMEKRDEWIV